MEFSELQAKLGNNLSQSNTKIQENLFRKANLLRNEILPIFEFKELAKKDKPIEFTIILIFNKLHAMMVSIENIILVNDGWLGMYVARYSYELYIKTKYIFDEKSKENILIRINKFLEVEQQDNIQGKLDNISDNDSFIQQIKLNHKEFYKKLNTVVHPNIESLDFHINGKNKDDNDRFLSNSVAMRLSLSIIFHIIETIYQNKDNLELINYPDIKKMEGIINTL